jgi:hypothetical protein
MTNNDSLLFKMKYCYLQQVLRAHHLVLGILILQDLTLGTDINNYLILTDIK